MFSGGKLTIKDSKGGGKIAGKDLQAVVALRNTDYDLEPPKLVIDCPNSTQIRNDGGHHVIFTEDGTDWGSRLNSKVELRGGTLAGATGTTAKGWGGSWGSIRPDDRGAGILAGEVVMSGGVVEDCVAVSQGGGICANQVDFSGGIIRRNRVGDTFGYGWGGGIAAVCLNMSGGEISDNHASYAGGGAFTYSLNMSGGTVKSNDCVDANSSHAMHVRGGGGIYLANPVHLSEDWVCLPGDVPETTVRTEQVEQLKSEVSYNGQITGGTISDNISDHTGGGLFINNGSKCYVRGESEQVLISGNQAKDVKYKYGLANTGGQGFAGGGIYVEHEDPNSDNPSTGGFVMVYDSVVTDNSARFGGGVSGCGSSEMEIFSIDGALVSENHVLDWPSDWQVDASGMERFPSSVDVYSDGVGGVDCRSPYGDPVGWIGWNGAGTVDGILQPVSGNQDKPLSFDGPFYLKSSVDLDTLAKAVANMGVVIKGNYSGSSGGGVGGNGVIYFGTRFSDESDTGSLKLMKQIDVPTEEDKDTEFTFSVKLTNGDQVCKSALCTIEQPDGTDSSTLLFAKSDGTFEVTLKHQESVTFYRLPEGLKYTVTEVLPDGSGYEPPEIKASHGTAADGEPSVSGTVSGAENVTFVNHRVSGSLTITKKVTGNAGDREGMFPFRLMVSHIDGAIGDTATAPVMFNGEPQSLAFKKQDGNAWWAAEFLMKDGDSLKLEDIGNYHYMVEETDTKGHMVSYEGNDNFVTVEDRSCIVRNDRNLGIPTGVSPGLGYGICALGLFGCIWSFRRDLRK